MKTEGLGLADARLVAATMIVTVAIIIACILVLYRPVTTDQYVRYTPIAIADILDNNEEYVGKQVEVTGIISSEFVDRTFPQYYLYDMQDNTKFIWVIPSDTSRIENGQYMRVRGILVGAWSNDIQIPGIVADQVEQISHTLIIFATEDTYINQVTPFESFQYDTVIKVASQENANSRGLIKFDLSNIAENAKILSAKLLMECAYSLNFEKMAVQAREILNDNWNGSVSWATMPVDTTLDLVVIDEVATVKDVIDGDTIAADNKIIRLANINTPKPSENENEWRKAMAYTASRCPKGSTIGLNLDNRQGETYGRVVAIVYYKDTLGEWVSLNSDLLKRGLANLWLHPPTEFESESRLLCSHVIDCPGRYSFDVTDAVVQSIENDKVISIMLKADTESYDNIMRFVCFRSSNYVNVAQRPHLRIVYIMPELL